jgi:hypothetical protein
VPASYARDGRAGFDDGGRWRASTPPRPAALLPLASTPPRDAKERDTMRRRQDIDAARCAREFADTHRAAAEVRRADASAARVMRDTARGYGAELGGALMRDKAQGYTPRISTPRCSRAPHARVMHSDFAARHASLAAELDAAQGLLAHARA